MRILIANKYYYPRGGSEIYTIELEQLLSKNGHEVAVFAMQHQANIHNDYESFFPSEMDVNKRDIRSLLKSLIRPFGSREVRRNFKDFIRTFKPQVVHLNNIHSQLSPALAIIARKEKVPVVWTLHDHKLLCPRYDCIRDDKPCELCFDNRFNVIRYRCMKNSLLASCLAYFEAIFWNKKLLDKITDVFITPSLFLMNNMAKGEYDQKKMKVIPNFIPDSKLSEIGSVKDNYYCYVGRLSKEKGVETLLKAAAHLPHFRLIVVGTGPLEFQLKEKYAMENIKFVGFQKWQDLKSILGQAKFLTIPSECYENNPLSVIESLCLGTPVLGARIGGIPELINEGINGYTFTSGDQKDLISKITLMHDGGQKFNYQSIAQQAKEKFCSESYYRQVLNIYKNLHVI
ncbi:MAG: glycosyltransferase [Bacteroidales bacterium]|jgi:glycosyltransferase involved in cell wall biosynthesis|nr:glycosyltransferase [Bacteroidales bacterium]